MCGFLAVLMLRGGNVDQTRLAMMRDSMSHRGPDGAGVYSDGPVSLAHRRLSVIDLSTAGHQPMCNEDRTVWLTFNGEIYNYVELTQELKAKGHQFKSRTDSEVILHLWEEEGEACLERLNGMFAFTLWDSRRQQLFGARDRAGIKPFHYYQSSDRIIAASEIKAILADPTVPRRPDFRGLADMLTVGFPLGEKTCFEGIRQLQPGWAFSVKDGQLRTWPYWDLTFNYNHSRSLDNTVGEMGELLQDAVRLQCRSDALVGCHLSGGLDSSTITAVATQHRSPLHTFSIRFDGGARFDESRFARAVASHCGTVHHESVPGPGDFSSLLARLAWHADGPMPDVSSFSYYCASRLAANHVKVALTGHGGDEIFAGYPAQFEATFGDASMFARHRRSSSSIVRATHLQLAMRRYGTFGAIRRAIGRRLGNSHNVLEKKWMQLHCSMPPADNPLLSDEFQALLNGYDPREEYLAPLRKAQTDEVLDRCLYHDLRCYLPSLLFQEDRASMSVSLESRVPLLDHRLIEFLGTVPPSQKVANRTPKNLLRQFNAGRLPLEVVNRNNKGSFTVPIEQWFSGPLAPMVDNMIASPTTRRRGLFDQAELHSGWHGVNARWSALTVELWFRLFIDRDQEWLDRVEETRPASRPVESEPVDDQVAQA